ncbi:PREDICTED: thioredoxin H9-like [Lupinus angustifolius]|uniref:thioredoxin H9-like n=1 Tax=Lupinus angustifolius TaxID=3871 RepID=UPI00092F3F7F|nr:PREDICTED: thioredoxin H9-like [Lupinus angustifolius]XP_019456533.1 PREDICTED: thioredoxin H9-like [Lupinus angustifolius]
MGCCFSCSECSCCCKLPRFSCAWLMCCFCPKLSGSDGDSDQSHHAVLFSSRNVHRITSMQSWEANLSQANKDGKAVVANFTASWSHPCRDVMPIFSELANKYSFLVFLTVDADELAELCNSWNINATPTFYFLKDGRQLDKLVGSDKLELKKKVAAVADLVTNSPN